LHDQSLFKSKNILVEVFENLSLGYIQKIKVRIRCSGIAVLIKLWPNQDQKSLE